MRLADVGSGAGLPAFVLAVARPGWHVTAVDTLRKRCDFMEEAAQKLGIQASSSIAAARTSKQPRPC